MRNLAPGFLCCTVVAAVLCAAPLRSGAQSAPAASAAPAAPPPTAGSALSGAAGGSSLPIESLILAYQGLQLSADAIAHAVKQRMGSNPNQKIVVATAADVTAILQLRIVLSQIEDFNTRLIRIKSEVDDLKCQPTPSPTPTRAGLTATAAAAAIGSIVSSLGQALTTVASFTATTETASSQSASFLDTTLIDLVGESITSTSSASVYVPTVAPPDFAAIEPYADNQSLRSDTYLFSALQRLDANRLALEKDAQNKLSNPLCKNDSTAAAARKLIVAALAATEKFEGSLFGLSGLPSTGLITAVSTPEPKSSAKPGTVKPAAVSNTITIAPEKAPSAPAGPSAMQRLLYIDLLAHKLGGSTHSNNAYLLAVHVRRHPSTSSG